MLSPRAVTVVTVLSLCLAAGLWLGAGQLELSALVLLSIALAGTVVSAYRARREIRSWPWVSLVAFVLIGVAFFIGLGTSTRSPSMLALAVMVTLAFAGGLFELVRSQRGSARRVLAGSTIAISLVVGWFFARAMLHPSGILGRWLDGFPPSWASR